MMQSLFSFLIFFFLFFNFSYSSASHYQTIRPKDLRILPPKKHNIKTKIIIHFDENVSNAAIESRIKTLENRHQIDIKPLFHQDLTKVLRKLERYERYDERDYFDPRRVYQVDYDDILKLKSLLRNLKQEKIIDLVYPYPKAKLSSIDEIPDLSQNQTYLNDLQIQESHITDSLPNERRRYRNRRTFGQRTTMILFEQSWNENHSDLSLGEESFINDPICENINENPNCPFWKAHGTAMAGLMNAQDNEHGILGVAPEADLKLYSLGNNTLAEALGDVLVQLTEGKIPSSPILVIPQQYPGARANIFDRDNSRGYLPAEAVPIHFILFNALSAFGATVIQSAGNGSVDLNDESNYGLCDEDDVCHKNLAIERSDAIMVATPNLEMDDKADFSNCGDRIDFFAPGINLTTSSIPFEDSPYNFNDPDNLFDFLNDDPDNYYINNFSGTSASAAIVAGVASLIQNRIKDEQYGRLFLRPNKLKEILNESAISLELDCGIGKQIQVYEAFMELEETDLGYQHFPLRIGRGDSGMNMFCSPNDQFDCIFDYTPRRTLQNYDDYMRYLREEATEEAFNAIRDSGLYVPCIENKTFDSHYFCPDKHIWPPNTKTAKKLDFDGDGRADPINMYLTENRDNRDRNMDVVIEINLSSLKNDCRSPIEIPDCSIFEDSFGPVALPDQINYRAIPEFTIISYPPRLYYDEGNLGRFFADINNDGRSDFVLFDTRRSRLKVLYMNRELAYRGQGYRGVRQDLDYEWDLDLHYDLERSNPQNILALTYLIIQDYDNNGFLDIGIIDKNGLWKIDYNGPDRIDGIWDEEINFIRENHLPQNEALRTFIPLYGKLSPRSDYNIGYVVPYHDEIDENESGKLFLLEGPDFQENEFNINYRFEEEDLSTYSFIYKSNLTNLNSKNDLFFYNNFFGILSTKAFSYINSFEDPEENHIWLNPFLPYLNRDLGWYINLHSIADYDGDGIDEIAFQSNSFIFIYYSSDQFIDLLDENGIRLVHKPNEYHRWDLFEPALELEFAF